MPQESGAAGRMNRVRGTAIGQDNSCGIQHESTRGCLFRSDTTGRSDTPCKEKHKHERAPTWTQGGSPNATLGCHGCAMNEAPCIPVFCYVADVVPFESSMISLPLHICYGCWVRIRNFIRSAKFEDAGSRTSRSVRLVRLSPTFFPSRL